MPSEYHHGLTFVHENNEIRPVDPAKMTTIGVVGTAGEGVDDEAFPLNEPRMVFSHEIDKLQKLGIGGTLRDAADAVTDQGISASMIFQRVEEADDIEKSLSNIIGSAVLPPACTVSITVPQSWGLSPILSLRRVLPRSALAMRPIRWLPS